MPGIGDVTGITEMRLSPESAQDADPPGWNSFNEIQQRPDFWVAVAFAGGLIVGSGFPAIARIAKRTRRNAVFKTWYSPLQAIEEFVSSDLRLEDKRARDRAENLMTAEN